MTDQQRVDELASDAIGGMTEEIASELYEYLTHEDNEVKRRAFAAFESTPRDETERINYERVVNDAARILRNDAAGDIDLELRIYDTLQFIINDHAPQAVERFDEDDRNWARELLDHDIYVYRELGCTILGHIGNTNDIERITDLAANDESDDVRNTAQTVVNNRDS